MREPDHPEDIERALKAVSGILAISKCLLLLQYCVPLYFAHRARRPIRPILLCMVGIVINAACWFGALGASFSHDKAGTIARIALWSVGLLTEWLFVYVSVTRKGAVHFELEYYAERMSALTLIMLVSMQITLRQLILTSAPSSCARAGRRRYVRMHSRGSEPDLFVVIGIFESFKVFLSGVAVSINSGEMVVALFCAVLILRCMYCE